MQYDVVIAGAGPAGLSAALNLGRARKRVLLCDAAPSARRNAAAEHIQGFVTRDGTPPSEFRRIAREQLAPYKSVEIRDEPITAIRGERGNFELTLAAGTVAARRVMLCTGMIDELPDIEGFRPLWGHSIVQCPYCHGWEAQDRRFGYLADNPDMLAFGLLLRGWTNDVVVFTGGRFEVPTGANFGDAGVRIEQRRIARLIGEGQRLLAVEFEDGEAIERDVLFAHLPQRQVELVGSLGLTLDAFGHVVVDAHGETSHPGIYAAGDLTTRGQSAVLAASAGAFAGGMLNHGLTIELATSGSLA